MPTRFAGDSAPPDALADSQGLPNVRRARYGTVDDTRQRRPQSHFALCVTTLLRALGPFFLSLLIRPPRVLGRPARQIGFARHFLRSAKFLTMAKQKNRLTTTKTLNRSVVTFFFGRPSDRTGLTDHHDIPHTFHRRPWRAVRPFEVDYRVAPDGPTLHTQHSGAAAGPPKRNRCPARPPGPGHHRGPVRLAVRRPWRALCWFEVLATG